MVLFSDFAHVVLCFRVFHHALFFVSSVFTDAVHFLLADFSHDGAEFFHGCGVQGIENVLAVSSVDDESGFDEDFHIVGECRLRDGECLLQFVGCTVPCRITCLRF